MDIVVGGKVLRLEGMEGLWGKELFLEVCFGICIVNGGVEERVNGGE